MHVRLIIAYDGTPYLGFQYVKEGPTIEGVLRERLETIFQHPIHLQAASRTDRGVHAEGQIVSFHTHKEIAMERLHTSLNQLLPTSIRIFRCEKVPVRFHPSLDVYAKEYHYFVARGKVHTPFERLFSWHYPFELNTSLMEKACPLFLGTRDFAALANASQKQPQSTVRTLHQISIKEDGVLLRFEICGDHFLYKMVRNIVGTLIGVGSGKIHLTEIKPYLHGKNRCKGGMTAPAHGLILKRIFYKGQGEDRTYQYETP